jgi:hypothetical protein
MVVRILDFESRSRRLESTYTSRNQQETNDSPPFSAHDCWCLSIELAQNWHSGLALALQTASVDIKFAKAGGDSGISGGSILHTDRQRSFYALAFVVSHNRRDVGGCGGFSPWRSGSPSH